MGDHVLGHTRSQGSLLDTWNYPSNPFKTSRISHWSPVNSLFYSALLCPRLLSRSQRELRHSDHEMVLQLLQVSHRQRLCYRDYRRLSHYDLRYAQRISRKTTFNKLPRCPRLGRNHLVHNHRHPRNQDRQDGEPQHRSPGSHIVIDWHLLHLVLSILFVQVHCGYERPCPIFNLKGPSSSTL